MAALMGPGQERHQSGGVSGCLVAENNVQFFFNDPDEVAADHGIHPGRFDGDAGFAELAVHNSLQVVGTAVFKKEQLLGNHVAFLGDAVGVRVVIIQGLVGFL